MIALAAPAAQSTSGNPAVAIVIIVSAVVLGVCHRRAKRTRAARRAERARRRVAVGPKRYGRRIARWALYRIFRRRFVWHPAGIRPGRISDPLPLARRGLIRTTRIRIDRHLMVCGLSGSGKSSTIRIMAAWALADPDCDLELWDLKPGAPEAELYAGKAKCLTTPKEIVARVRELVADPARDGRALALIVDEGSSLVRALSGAQLAEFATLVDIARVYRIFIWFGVQHPSRDNVPSVLQANLGATVAHRVRSRVESDVVFPSMPEWMPHELAGAGSCLVYEPDAKPHRLRALWLSEERFRALPARLSREAVPQPEPVTAPVPGIAVPAAQEPAPVRLSEQQTLVCMALEMADRPLTEKETVAATGLPQPRVNDAFRALVRKGVAAKLPGQYPAQYALTTVSEESS